MAALRSRVLAGYGGCLRTARRVFGDDAEAYAAACTQLSEAVRAKAGETDAEAIERGILELEEVEAALREVVQGKLTERGTYAMSVEAEQAHDPAVPNSAPPA
eukprot:PLAT4530.2.p1 GENE.PLAT4530.2~~PLAT4530.2.p1  ORF type:complete len:117 (-),score=19.88 PLAT4530.2:112-420(-)